MPPRRLPPQRVTRRSAALYPSACRSVEGKKAEAAASEIVALEDDQVEDVAGGYYYVVDDCTAVSTCRVIENQCANDFVDTSCWWNDACTSWSTYYYDCSGSFYNWDIKEDIEKIKPI